MKNKRPIILNCFSRGGSNILWNIFLSHPEVCSPIEETLQIFRFDWRSIRKAGLEAIIQTRQPRFFDQWMFKERHKISPQARSFIDKTLFEWKLKTLEDEEMRWKYRDVVYSRDEVVNSRLVIKNNNGIIFLSDRFLEIYTDAVFIALVRDPIPLYESHKRHRTPVSTSPEIFAKFYQDMITRMKIDASRWDCYHILRFEDILHDPVKAINQVYSHAGLDVNAVPQMRFKAKPHYMPDGTHGSALPVNKHFWFAFNHVNDFIEMEINKFQTELIPSKEREQVAIMTLPYRQTFGYE